MDNTVKVVGDEGQEIVLVVKSPSHQTMQSAQMIYNGKVAELLRAVACGRSQLLPRCQLDEYLEKIGIWTQADKVAMATKQLELRACEILLKKGGIKVSEGKEVAMRMCQLRADLLYLFQKKSQFQNSTIESVAEQHKFIFIVVQTVYEQATDTPFFASIDDYLSREQESATRDAAARVAAMYFGYDEKDAAKLPENQWLRQFKFMNADGRFVDDQGRLVDIAGRLIDKDGRFINEVGEFCDYQGQKVDVDGNPVVDETKPFLDESGQPISVA